jgi:hypothetical protein
MYRRLAEAAALNAAGQASLWRDPGLQLALNWSREEQPDAHWAAQYGDSFESAMRFLEMSQVARAAERQAARRRKVYPGILALALVVVLGAWAVKASRDSAVLAAVSTERDKAQQARADAERARDEARQAEKLAVERTNALLAQFGWDRQKLTTAAPNQYAIDQSLNANRVIQQATAETGRDRRRAITVEYFPKNVDENKVEAALIELGFTLSKPHAFVTGIPTNAIWFGSPVGIDDVKLVALTLIRAGVQIRAIRPSQLPANRDRLLIQVGADASIVDEPALTVEAIQRATRFTR